MDYIKLAKTLPRPIITYLTRYPPGSAAAKEAFQCTRHPVTGRLHDPKYSARRKKQLYDIAERFNLLTFLPEPSALHKKVMKGTIRFKGTKAERNRPARVKEMEQAMRGMKRRIKEWRANSYQVK